jgi:excisionase family DNA binding protein
VIWGERVSPNGDLIRSGEAARLLGVGTSTLQRWAVAGKIRYFVVGPSKQRRFQRSDIEKLVQERAAKAEPPTEGQGK